MAEHSQDRGRSRFAEELEGALAWWREAGVAHDFTDDAIDRLAEAREDQGAGDHSPDAPGAPGALETVAPGAHEPTESPRKKLGGDRGQWPSDLEAFGRWWLEDPDLEVGGTGPRIAPRGPRGARLMVLVSQPGLEDRARLLEGRQGQLVDSFLRAAGLDQAQVYFASALPRAVAMPDWAQLGDAGLGEVIAHHISLAQPQRLLVLSRNILPLMGHGAAQGAHLLTREHGMSGDLPVLATSGPEELLRSAQRRQRLWQDWLDWTAG